MLFLSLKTITQFNSQNTNHTVSILTDFCKAFDMMVNNFISSNSLLERDMPPDIIITVINCRRNQTSRL